MKTIIESCYALLNRFRCIKCHKDVRQIFHIKFGKNMKFIATWLCLDCFNEVFKYCKY